MAKTQASIKLAIGSEKLEKRMRYLLEKIQETQSILDESNPTSSKKHTTIKKVSGISRKEILVGYVKERLARLKQ